MTNHQTVKNMEALRDFFLCQNSNEMAKVYQRLTENSADAAPEIDDWKAVEFAFNRLFVGPGPLAAPPYASVYLEPEPQIMGQSTMKVRGVYNLLGLTLPWKNAIPDDHISFELDAYRQLTIAAYTVESAELQALHRYLVTHMQAWMFQFIKRVKTAKTSHPAINFVVTQLESWLIKAVPEK